MKKILSVAMIFLVVLSTFSIVPPQVKAESEVITLPVGAWFIGGRWEDDETILHRIDVDSVTPGDQQIVYASPGQTISISYTFQMWSSGGPGIIKQALFAYSWASSWPPYDAYTPLYDGGSGGYYPGFNQTDTFSITVPLTSGEYKVWFCSHAHYSMGLALQDFTEPPTMLPHAIIIVSQPTPLEVAEKAAVYVISQAISECGGYKWLYYDSTGGYDRPAHMARIGTFLVALYEKTGNSTYLDYAKGLAQWFICKAIPDSGGYKWKHADQGRSDWYLSPTNHDVGEFLLRMYQVTGNTTYLDYANGAAQWMVAMAEPEAGGWFVPYNPPGKYGSQTAAGIQPSREAHTVTFLLHMYQQTGNTDYLDIVKGTAEWLISGPDIVAENGGYKWAHDRPYYVNPAFKYHMPGNSLIALFFYEAYQELGNETYLEYANGAVQWILSQAVSDGDDYKWPLNQGGTTYYLLPLMEGYAWDNVNDVLLVAYSITSNSTYLEYAKKHANWVVRQAVSEGGGYKFPWYEGAVSYYYHAFINALVYRFLSEIYNVVGNAIYSEYANGAFAWIVNNATTTDGGYKWKTIDYYPYYPWWFSPGASGIGYYLISAAPIGPQDLDPWEYCPYVYLDYGYGFPWDTTPDLPVNVLYTGTYFWGDLRVIQYWFHWNVDYMWWFAGFVNAAYKYTIGEGWTNPLRQAVKQHDWEPVFIIVNDQGSIDSVLVRWHYEWIKYDLTVAGAYLLHPTYQDTHIKLWFSIGSHTPLSWHFAFTTPVLLKIGGLIAPPPFDTLLGLTGTYAQPPLYSFQDQGITYPSGMESWDEDLALSLGFDPADLEYVNNPTLAYSELLLPPIFSVVAESPVNILVTAPNGLRVGYDSDTGNVVNEIEGSTYSGPGTEPQVVNIPSPLPGVYNVDIIGTDSGVYTITIWSMVADGSLAGIETNAGETVEGEADCYSVSISETGEMEVFSWEYIFEDSNRGTMLKISTDDKYFQFIAPDKEFSIKEANKMIICKHTIILWHKDEEIKIFTIAVNTRIDFCFAYAKDMETGKRYILIDKPDMES